MGFSQEASKITHNTKAFLSNPTGSIIEHMAISTDPATKELSMLSYIDQNSDATQRELSEHIGVSLGTINIMVKQPEKGPHKDCTPTTKSRPLLLTRRHCLRSNEPVPISPEPIEK